MYHSPDGNFSTVSNMRCRQFVQVWTDYEEVTQSLGYTLDYQTEETEKDLKVQTSSPKNLTLYNNMEMLISLLRSGSEDKEVPGKRVKSGKRKQQNTTLSNTKLRENNAVSQCMLIDNLGIESWWFDEVSTLQKSGSKTAILYLQSKEITASKKGCRRYNALSDAPNLFLDLAKVPDCAIDVSYLKRFVQTYGLPCALESETLSYGFDIAIRKMDMREFLPKLRLYKHIFQSAVALPNQNDEVLRRIWGMPSEYKKTQVLTLAKERLEKAFSQKHFEISNIFDGNYYQEISFLDLFGVAYFQLIRHVMAHGEWGRCEECETYFPKTHGKMKFCPTSIYGSVKSQCQNINQKKHKQQIT